MSKLNEYINTANKKKIEEDAKVELTVLEPEVQETNLGKLVEKISELAEENPYIEPVKEDVVDLDQERDKKDMKNFHSDLMGKVDARGREMQQQVDAHEWSIEVGDRFLTDHSIRMGWPPMTVIGKRIAKKGLDPSSDLAAGKRVEGYDIPYVYYESPDGTKSSLPEWAIARKFQDGPVAVENVEETEFLNRIENVVMIENTKKREEVLTEMKTAQTLIKGAEEERSELMLIIARQNTQIEELKKSIHGIHDINKNVNQLVEGVKRKERELQHKESETNDILQEAKEILREAATKVQYKTKIIDPKGSQKRIVVRDEHTGLIKKFVNEDGNTVAVVHRDAEGDITEIVEKR